MAGNNLEPFHALIEARTGLAGLQRGTLNISLAEAYHVVLPDAVLTRSDYYNAEEIRFQRCRLGGLRCLIMRPETHESGQYHGPAHLELMSTVHLKTHLGLDVGDVVTVEVEGDGLWWDGPNEPTHPKARDA